MPKYKPVLFKAWWVVASDKNPEHGWHWDQFFKEYDDSAQYFDWGGPDWIKSSNSFPLIKQMRSNEIVVAYQAGEGIVGLARLGSEGYMHKDSLHYDSFDLRPQPHVALERPIPYQVIRDYPHAAQHIEFVWAGFKSRSVFGVTATGLDIVVKLTYQVNPGQRKQVESFLKFD
ncbi:MAG: hypothetical protein IT317_15045 [Anaerolineales bacterium]|nr:hypothetical protein [Anaerolineales bacterium]